MKRMITLFWAMLIILTLCLSLSSCTQDSEGSAKDKTQNNTSNANAQNVICNASTPEERLKYGERYVLKTEESNMGFIFNSDGTGEYHIYEVSWDKTVKIVRSGYVRFDWRSASDGAIHLFKNGETQIKDDNTAPDFNLNPVKMLFVSEDFVTYYEYESGYIHDLNGGGKVYSSVIKKDYIRAGSPLDKND